MANLTANYLCLLGLLLEIIGVIMMANKYIITKRKNIPWLLLKGLFQKNISDFSIGYADRMSQEEKSTVLRGLALIFLGFVVQFAGTLLSTINLDHTS